MRFLRYAAAIGLLLMVMMCSTYNGDVVERSANQHYSSSRTLTRQELADDPDHSLDEFIRLHRPSLLNARGSTLQLWLDGRPYPLSTLTMLSADAIDHVEWISAAEAQFRFGQESTAGAALLVTTRRGPL